MKKVVNKHHSAEHIGSYTFEPGDNYLPAVPEALSNMIDQVPSLELLKGDFDPPQPEAVETEEVDPEDDGEAGAVLTFEEINGANHLKAKKQITTLEDVELLEKLSQEAKTDSVKEAAKERLEQLKSASTT